MKKTNLHFNKKEYFAEELTDFDKAVIEARKMFPGVGIRTIGNNIIQIEKECTQEEKDALKLKI